MAGSSEAKVAAIGSITATIAAVAAWLKSGKVEAGQVPKEVIQLLIAIAASSDETRGTVQQILDALGAGGQGWPANTDSITGLRVDITPPNGVQLPSIIIPSGMALVIKAWALNPAWLFVGPSLAEARNINQSFYLMPSETVSYFVQNADEVYIAGMTAAGLPTAGCFASLTVEQRRRGGGV